MNALDINDDDHTHNVSIVNYVLEYHNLLQSVSN